MSKPRVLWEDRDYLALWSNGVISVSDGVGFVGTVDATETRKLYEALGKYYGDDKLKSELAAMKRQRDQARRGMCELIYQSEGNGDWGPASVAERYGWDCYKGGGS